MSSAYRTPPTTPPPYQPPARDGVHETAFLHKPEAGAKVPFIQAVITGALVAALFAFICIKLRVPDAWFYIGVIFCLITLAMWLVLQKHWFTLTDIHRLERLTGLDLNKDGQIGGESFPPRVHSVRVNVHQETDSGYPQMQSVDFPISEETLRTLAEGLLNGMPFSEREWAGAGKPFSINEFRTARSEMLKRGLLALANPKAPQQGFVLTRAGRAVFEHFAGLGASPSPTDDVSPL